MLPPVLRIQRLACLFGRHTAWSLWSMLLAYRRIQCLPACMTTRPPRSMTISFSHLWLCTLMTIRVLCIICTAPATGSWMEQTMCTRYRQLEGISHLSLTCGCAHRLSRRTVCCALYVHPLQAVGRNKRTVLCIATCTCRE